MYAKSAVWASIWVRNVWRARSSHSRVPEEALGHRIVVAIAHRAMNANHLTAFAEAQRRVVTVVVGVVDDALIWASVPDRHFQRSHDELGAQIRAPNKTGVRLEV